ncbi:MAG: hypothetical protein BWY63_01144 [Chloroflexi bacterium ADurb.Bin360]|nr:MAG: hypothetical protein BWY63_01144 [Chloroflexi bacterium ADurb.Bin360]
MILRLLLAIIGWCGFLLLQLLLMGIARFFERSSSSRTFYKLYLIPIALTALGALIYWIRIPFAETGPNFTGDPLANGLFFIAGVTLLVLGSILRDQMLQGAQP